MILLALRAKQRRSEPETEDESGGPKGSFEPPRRMSDHDSFESTHDTSELVESYLNESSPTIEVKDFESILERLRAEGEFTTHQIKTIARQLTIVRSERDVHSDQRDVFPTGHLIGHYVVQSLINQGSAGHIYMARDTRNDDLVAVKVMKNVKLSERFLREMRLVLKLAHPNIVVAREVSDIDGLPYLVMELLDGPDLHAYVRRNGPVPWKKTCHWILQAARALEHADGRGLTHRDVKPDNLILHNGNRLKLADLGLATRKTDTLNNQNRFETHDGTIGGTLAFMSPEQARSLTNADARSDIYSLGATWFYLLAGKPMLKGTSISEQLTALLVDRDFESFQLCPAPEEVLAVLQQMLRYDPKDRFTGWRDVIDALVDIAESANTIAEPSVRVLLVEDDADDFLITSRILAKINKTVTIDEASSLQQATRQLDQNPYDVVLLDLELPDSSGIETARHVMGVRKNTPVIVLSGTSDPAVAKACKELGVDAYASKNDLSAHELERTVFVALSRKAPLADESD